MSKNWRYVAKDGNPPEEGVYWTTLIYDEYRNGKPTGRKVASVNSRYFGDITNDKQLAGWKMDGEPDTGLVWTMESGSAMSERVWAWMPMEEIEIAELPDGVIIDEGEA